MRLQRAQVKNPEVRRELAEPEDHALGRSRGGFLTKLQLVTNGGARPWERRSALGSRMRRF
jgi:hypothetical protein